MSSHGPAVASRSSIIPLQRGDNTKTEKLGTTDKERHRQWFVKSSLKQPPLRRDSLATQTFQLLDLHYHPVDYLWIPGAMPSLRPQRVVFQFPPLACCLLRNASCSTAQ
nr:uncharacterized protein LOC119171447 [Rhipicephalus microplus]